ncbi:MAG: alpha/beta hydrolase [Oligoflexales bacterium]|nr:alpha/beta hydrolase [Oligoflexales bacterium]
MKKILLFLALVSFAGSSFAEDKELRFYNPNLNSREAFTSNPELKSKLDSFVNLEDFGPIAYRKPLESNEGETIVLFHGIFGGASHRSYKELLTKLDDKGYRVYIMDLPGVGASYKPKRRYNIEVVDSFIQSFLENVVKEPAHVIAASTITTSALYVASTRPELFASLTALAPVGARGLKNGPSFFQKIFTRFEKRYENSEVEPYINLLTPDNIKFYSSFAYKDVSLVDDNLVEESQIQQYNLDQRWVTYAFVSGLIYRSYELATQGLNINKVPTQALVGDSVKVFRPAKWIPSFQKPETAEDFKKVNSDISYHVVEDSAGAIWREQPDNVASLIDSFISGLK